MEKRLFITGYASINKLGEDKDVIWQKYCNNSIDRNYGKITEFEPDKYFEKKGLRYMSRSAHMLLAVVKMILEQEGYAEDTFCNDETGVVIGNVFGSLKSICDFDRIMVEEGPKGVSPMSFSNCVKNSAASNISIKYGQKAFNVTLASGMASALDAICYAGDMLLCDRCNTVFVGGVEEFCEQLLYGFRKNGLITKNYKRYMEDRNSEGIALSEGASMILVRTEDSITNTENIYGIIKGYQRKIFSGETIAEQMQECMREAVETAGLQLSDIDVIMGNFNGIHELDYAEERAIKNLFSESGDKLLCIPKKYFGETYSTGGGLAVNLALQMLERQKTGNQCYLLCDNKENVWRECETKKIDNILVNGFDSMGQLVSVVIGR